MEILQIILIISLIILIVSLTAVTLYSIFVLKDLKETLEDTKEIVKTGRKVTSSLVIPLTAIMGIAGSISKGLDAVKSITSAFQNEDDYDDEEDI